MLVAICGPSGKPLGSENTHSIFLASQNTLKQPNNSMRGVEHVSRMLHSSILQRHTALMPQAPRAGGGPPGFLAAWASTCDTPTRGLVAELEVADTAHHRQVYQNAPYLRRRHNLEYDSLKRCSIAIKEPR